MSTAADTEADAGIIDGSFSSMAGTTGGGGTGGAGGIPLDARATMGGNLDGAPMADAVRRDVGSDAPSLQISGCESIPKDRSCYPPKLRVCGGPAGGCACENVAPFGEPEAVNKWRCARPEMACAAHVEGGAGCDQKKDLDSCMKVVTAGASICTCIRGKWSCQRL